MIYNLHIPKNYLKWGLGPKGKGRVQTLCGKSTLPRVTGIPTVTTDQLAGDFGSGDYGWCLACCAEIIKDWREFIEMSTEHPQNPHLMSLYSGAVFVAVNQLSLAK
jgi:hypothetical protein